MSCVSRVIKSTLCNKIVIVAVVIIIVMIVERLRQQVKNFDASSALLCPSFLYDIAIERERE